MSSKAKNRARAKNMLLLMFTTDGLRLYEFDGKRPSMVGVTLDNHDIQLNLDSSDLSDEANLWRVFVELRQLCPDKHVIMPYDTKVIPIDKAGGYAEAVYDRIIDPYFSSTDVNLSVEKLEQIKAEVKASTTVERETPVIPLLIAPSMSAQKSKKMKNQNQNSGLKTSDKVKGGLLVGSRAVHGTLHLAGDLFCQAVIGSETMVEQALLGTNRTFKQAFSEVREAREAKTRAIEQAIIDKMKEVPSSLNSIKNLKVTKNATPKTA